MLKRRKRRPSSKPKEPKPARKHIRLELAIEEHQKLRALAKLHDKTIVGYVRWMLERRLRRFSAGDENNRSRHVG